LIAEPVRSLLRLNRGFGSLGFDFFAAEAIGQQMAKLTACS